MNKYIIICFLIVSSFNTFAQSKGMLWGNLIADALHQAIALEKLPDIQNYFSSDTILVFTAKLSDDPDKEIEYYDLSFFLPSHIDKWTISPINQNEIDKKQSIDAIKYLILYITKNEETIKIDLICESKPMNKYENNVIDRGRLTVEFKHIIDQYWVISNIIQWFG